MHHGAPCTYAVPFPSFYILALIFAPHSPCMIHIGHAIKEVFDRQPRSCTVTWFARQINCHRANVYDIFSRQSIDTDLLRRISIVLGHNFFEDLARDIPPMERRHPAAVEPDAKPSAAPSPPPDIDTSDPGSV